MLKGAPSKILYRPSNLIGAGVAESLLAEGVGVGEEKAAALLVVMVVGRRL
jgi:hypothetical protein